MLSPSLALREHTSSASGGVAEWAEGIATASVPAVRQRSRGRDITNIRGTLSTSPRSKPSRLGASPKQQFIAAAHRTTRDNRFLGSSDSQNNADPVSRQRRTGPDTHEAVLVAHSRLCSALL